MSFSPDWAVRPEKILEQNFLQKNISKFDVIDNSKFPEKLRNFFSGCAEMDDDVVNEISRQSDISAEYMHRIQCIFNSDLKNLKDNLEAQSEFQEWFKSLDYNQLAKQNMVPRTRSDRERLDAVIRLFEFASVSDWQDELHSSAAMFRAQTELQDAAVPTIAWLKTVGKIARTMKVGPWDHKLFVESIPKLVSFTMDPNPGTFIPELTDWLAELGVKFIVREAPTGCTASGAVLFSDDNPIVAMTFRFKTDDHFWFSFFHECGHLALHNLDRSGFIEGEKYQRDAFEQEADSFAQNILLPAESLSTLISEIKGKSPSIKMLKIVRCARKIGIAPGIVVGQLQHHGAVPYSHFNKLKVYYRDYLKSS